MAVFSKASKSGLLRDERRDFRGRSSRRRESRMKEEEEEEERCCTAALIVTPHKCCFLLLHSGCNVEVDEH
jgi:hypothetical protein